MAKAYLDRGISYGEIRDVYEYLKDYFVARYVENYESPEEQEYLYDLLFDVSTAFMRLMNDLFDLDRILKIDLENFIEIFLKWPEEMPPSPDDLLAELIPEEFKEDNIVPFPCKRNDE